MPLINLTTAAIQRLQTMISAQEMRPEAVLLSIKSTGCSGLSYDLSFLAKISDAPAFADQVEINDVRVVVDPKAALYLVGATMDYQEDHLRSGFVFNNPNEVGRCGCGESFSVATPGHAGTTGA